MKADNFQAFKDQWKTLPRTAIDLTGRTVIVTGGTLGGLGYEASLVFAKLNPSRLILTARSVEAGRTAVEQILKLTGYKAEVWMLDLNDFKSVEAFAQKAKSELERLDIFLSNAGVASMSHSLSSYGYESAFQINNISNSLLNLLILPLLIQTSALPPPIGSKTPTFIPHLTITASGRQYGITSLPGLGPGEEGRTLELLSDKKRYKGQTYPESKAINILNARTLVSLLPPTTSSNGKPSVIINTIDPGFCHSGLSRSVTGPTAYVFVVVKFLFGRTTEVGARNLVYGCLTETSQGAYIGSCEEAEPSDFILSEEGRKIGAGIWEEMKAIWMKAGCVLV